ncbi:unnamed protein product [Closterium sp. NIES-64]|nr:unnamed protein product [Closterium sp. NIES-64]
MARSILSVGLAIFIVATLALSFAQATSAGRGVVTAENVASINQPSEGREQSHRKLQNGVKTASDGTPCNVVATRTAGSCRSTGCLETLYKQQRDCGLLVPTTQSGHGKGKIGSGRIPMPF